MKVPLPVSILAAPQHILKPVLYVLHLSLFSLSPSLDPSAQTTIVGLFYHNMHSYYKGINPLTTR